MSIATMLEVLEFFFDVFLISGGCANCCRRRQVMSRAPSRARSFGRAPIFANHSPPDYDQERQVPGIINVFFYDFALTTLAPFDCDNYIECQNL